MKTCNNLVTFVIPIKHHEHIGNINDFHRSFKQTISSITQQSCSDWGCIIVCNEGMPLPSLDSRIKTLFVDYPPNRFYDMEQHDVEICYEAIREDKGKKVLQGILHSGDSKYLMVVDDDDMIHNQLVRTIKDNDNGNGWFINKGFIWFEGSSILFKRNGFHHLCGTSHILRKAALNLHELETDISFVKKYLGSHLDLIEYMRQKASLLEEFPLRAVVYRVGHSEAHSKVLNSKWKFLKLLFRYKFKVTFLSSFYKNSFSLKE